mgnify:CR=1 FL=1
MKMSNMRNLCLILFGNTVYALAIVMFILPNDIITGGTTGLGIAVNHYFGLQIHTFVLIFNTLMFFWGGSAWYEFALTTLSVRFIIRSFWEYWRMFRYYRTSQTIRCFRRFVEV